MNNTLGTNVRVTLFGESHGKYIGAVLDGLPAGIPVNEEDISRALDARRPSGNLSTSRRESDKFEIVSGVFRGMTCGSPLCIIIPNNDIKSADYGEKLMSLRPGHADLTSHIRNAGYEDFRGGGHFSGRITAALVAAGAVVRSALESKGIYIGTHILSIGTEYDRKIVSLDDVKALKDDPFPVLDRNAGDRMKALIEATKTDGDSVGGTLESSIYGIPAGVGDPWFGTVEGKLSYALFSIPAIKGVEFGAGFSLAEMHGSEANDPLKTEDGKIVTIGNNCGGVLGGLTTGCAIIFKTVVKPTPTIFKEQSTVDISTGENTKTAQKGRHDPCIVHRAASVQSAVSALVAADMLSSRFGEEWLRQ